MRLRHEDAFDCLLFDIALEKAVRDARIQTNDIFNRSEQLLAYADDIDIIERSFQALSDVFFALVRPTRRLGLEVNAEKTKYVVTGEVPMPGEEVTFEECQFEKTNVFVYLGSLVTQDNAPEQEIRWRIIATNHCYFSSRAELFPQNQSFVFIRR
ncbi:uncharacterized protein [Halyomorpha halys]|uniref:uncharacterized protein n=1 Tax=Halyomorpha halys TaxID=286706 RepID=UPI0034D1C740